MPDDKPEILIIAYTDARTDPRVYRQAAHLREYFKVTLLARQAPDLPGIVFYQTESAVKSLCGKLFWAFNLLLGNSGPYLNKWRVERADKLAAQKFDLVLVNDANPLPLGFKLAKGAPVVFDAHEYYPAEFSGSLFWRLLFQRHYARLCRKFIPRCAALLTVSPGLAELYYKNFGVQAHLIHSAPDYEDLPVRPVQEKRIRLIHHGGASRDRRLEDTVAMLDFLDERFTLDLMLVGNPDYVRELKTLSAANPRIFWREPVPMPQISQMINEYDVGVFLLPPASENSINCLPNKLFEFIQARLAVAVSPLPEMSRLVKAHDLGVVAEGFAPQDMARALQSLGEAEVMRCKQNSQVAAGIYNAGAEMQRLAEILVALLEEKN